MAGRVQLESVGVADQYFTDDPEFTYWRKVYKKNSRFAKEIVTVDPHIPGDFGQLLKFVIPQNQGDLLTNVAFRIKLPPIANQNLGTGYTRFGWIESIGHAIIEYVDIFIGDIPIQRLTSDWLTIYGEHYFTQTKQIALRQLVGKYPIRSAATPVSDDSILYNTLNTYYTNSSAIHRGANTVQEYLVDIPFFFYRNPSLALPLCAITKQEVNVHVKLRDYRPLVVALDGSNLTLRPTLSTPVSLVGFHMELDVVHLEPVEVLRLQNTPVDMVITQHQMEKSTVPASAGYDSDPTQHRMRLEFRHPVKELYFIIQRRDRDTLQYFCSPLDYDNYNESYSQNGYGKYHAGRLVLYEHLEHLTLKLDDQDILTERTGKGITFLKAVQGGIHHSKTQLIRRFYSYAFGTEPEKPYPTGQINMSHVKEQRLDLSLYPSQYQREVRVYAISYNILRLVDGFCKTIFDDKW